MDALLHTPLSTRLWLLREPARPARIRRSPRAPAFAVGTVCVGAFMGQLDASIVTLALPRIGAGLGDAAGAVRWVLLAYVLVLALALVPVGLLADRFGRKLLYTYGFAVFTLGSVLCGLAPALGWLIAARGLQGLGAAMLQANSVALIVESLPPRMLPRGLGVQGAAQAVGLALGPAIGGLLLALGGWQLIFLVNLPAGLLGIALAWVLLPRSRTADGQLRGAGQDEPLHVAGAGAPNGASEELRRGDPGAAPPSAAPRERFDRRALAVGLGGAMVAYAVMFGTLYSVSYHLAALHLPTALAGLELAILPVALGICAPLAGRLAEHVDARVLTLGGPLFAGLGLGVLLMGHGGGAGLPVGLALVGAGVGTFIPLNNATVMGAAPRSRVGVLSGILNATRCLGTALGVALPGVL
ncbi:MAG: MFS transporter [Solirubrobacteraceae bacterium]